jgi:ATP-dependent RNA helicase DeaD
LDSRALGTCGQFTTIAGLSGNYIPYYLKEFFMTFKELGLRPEIVTILDNLEFTIPTEIQSKAIPVLINTPKIDFLGQAQTGTGKTLAFGLPLIQSIDKTLKHVQAIIVAPTRELALQITQSLRTIAQPLSIVVEPIVGGMSMTEQIKSLKRTVHIVVATPGRVNDHVRRRTLKLDQATTLILDEADIMLDMGFKEEVDEIIQNVSSNRQLWLFSATIKPAVNAIIKKYMHKPTSISTSKTHIGAPNTKQYFCIVPMRDRMNVLGRFIDYAPSFYGFIFCPTKMLTDEVAERLRSLGYAAQALHGDMGQAARNRVIKQFKDRTFTILVATDVAARGIDVSDTTHVVNYTLPNDHESYVHRIGRTGRAGKDGMSITFIGRQDMGRIFYLEKQFNISIKPLDIPSVSMIAQSYRAKALAYIDQLCTKETEQDVHTTDLEKSLAGYDHAQLCKALAQLTIQTICKPLKSMTEIEHVSSHEKYAHTNPDQAEVALFVGSDDGITKDDVIALIQANSTISVDELEKIKVLKRRVFIKASAEQATALLTALQDKKMNGHKVRAALSDPSENQGGGRSFDRGGDRGGDRKSSFKRSKFGSRSRGGSSRSRSY